MRKCAAHIALASALLAVPAFGQVLGITTQPLAGETFSSAPFSAGVTGVNTITFLNNPVQATGSSGFPATTVAPGISVGTNPINSLKSPLSSTIGSPGIGVGVSSTLTGPLDAPMTSTATIKTTNSSAQRGIVFGNTGSAGSLSGPNSLNSGTSVNTGGESSALSPSQQPFCTDMPGVC